MRPIAIYLSAGALLFALAVTVTFFYASGTNQSVALPIINYEPKCELAGKFVGLQKNDDEVGENAGRLCISNEKNARDWLQSQWKVLSPDMQNDCLEHVQTTRKDLEYSSIMKCVLDRSDE